MRCAVMLVGKIGEELARFFRAHPEAGRTVAFAFVRFGQGQRQFADAAQQPLRVAPSGNVIRQDPGIELVFGVSDVFGQRIIRMIDMRIV